MPFNKFGKGEFQTDFNAASSACLLSKRRIRSAWLICTACTCFTSICMWYKSSLVAGKSPSMPVVIFEWVNQGVSQSCWLVSSIKVPNSFQGEHPFTHAQAGLRLSIHLALLPTSWKANERPPMPYALLSLLILPFTTD